MALLDLQSMEEPEETRGLAAKSGGSKGCNNQSGLSLLLCH
jgi:Lanthionine-containing peptide SapB precursor RamS